MRHVDFLRCEDGFASWLETNTCFIQSQAGSRLNPFVCSGSNTAFGSYFEGHETSPDLTVSRISSRPVLIRLSSQLQLVLCHVINIHRAGGWGCSATQGRSPLSLEGLRIFFGRVSRYEQRSHFAELVKQLGRPASWSRYSRAHPFLCFPIFKPSRKAF